MFYFSKIQFEIELLDNYAPMGFWGIKLRGGFGEILKQTLCDHPQLVRCSDCERFLSCEFPLLFKPRRVHYGSIAGQPLGDKENLPAPYVMEPPVEMNGEMMAGSRVSFGFVGLGPSAEIIGQIIETFGELGMSGLHNESRRARYQLVEVRDMLGAGRSLHALGNLSRAVVREASSVILGMLPLHMPDELIISFSTPVRTTRDSFPPLPSEDSDPFERKQNGAVVIKSKRAKGVRDFYDLVLLLTDRIAAVWQLYGQGWIGQAEFYRWRNRLLQASKEIVTKDLELRRKSYVHFAGDQQKFVELDGFVGAMHLCGDFTPFMEFLLLGEILHVGESTTKGFGQYKVIY